METQTLAAFSFSINTKNGLLAVVSRLIGLLCGYSLVSFRHLHLLGGGDSQTAVTGEAHTLYGFILGVYWKMFTCFNLFFSYCPSLQHLCSPSA